MKSGDYAYIVVLTELIIHYNKPQAKYSARSVNATTIIQWPNAQSYWAFYDLDANIYNTQYTKSSDPFSLQIGGVACETSAHPSTATHTQIV